MRLSFGFLRLRFLFAILLVSTGSAAAQTAPSIDRIDSLVAASQAALRAQRVAAEASAATDTAAALHRLPPSTVQR